MSNKYNILSREQYFQGDFSLISIPKESIELVREWRNDQINVLRQSQNISAHEQKEYYEKNIWPSFSYQKPKNLVLLFLLGNVPVGYGGLVVIRNEIFINYPI